MQEPDKLIRGVKELSSNWQTTYDYFKHLTTLGLGAILFISAFLRSDKASVVQEISIALSILAFLACIWCSLMVMTILTNMMLYYSGVQSLIELVDVDFKDETKNAEHATKLENKVMELVDKVEKAEPGLKKRTKLAQKLFLAGVVLASIFVLLPILNKLLIVCGILKQPI